MRYLSVCSGIEAATVAWHPFGWTPVAFAEIGEFPSAVLAHRLPNVPNLGDMLQIRERDLDGPVELLIGGTPCQSFSLAGNRRGLDDDRGQLALAYVRLVAELQPRWFVWENVAHCLSANGGRDFGALARALVECGYHVAWRVLDAQGFGVPQRRRRVFVVGHHRAGRAAEVLHLSESGPRDLAPSRKSWVHDSQGLAFRPAVFGGRAPDVIDVAPCLTAGSGLRYDLETEAFVVTEVPEEPGVAGCWTASAHHTDENSAISGHLVPTKPGVRRLMPIECERLQGFPTGWTQIPWKGKPAERCPDGHRQKAIGNSMAVPVVRWLGEQIMRVEAAEGAGVFAL